MALTFETLAKQLIRRMRSDGDTFVELPTAGPYYDSEFGEEMIDALKDFSVVAKMLYTPRRTFLIPALSGGYRIINWSNSVHSTSKFYDPTEIYVDGKKITRKSVEEIEDNWHPTKPQNVPLCWAKLDEDRIIFDCNTPDAGVSNCFAKGYYEHGDITADTGTGSEVDMPRNVKEIFLAYAQVRFRANSAKDEIGFRRIEGLIQAAQREVSRLYAERFANEGTILR